MNKFAVVLTCLTLLACGETNHTNSVKTISKIPSNTLSVEQSDPKLIGKGNVEISILPGSIARYLVNEQLARKKLPNDAIGSTNQVFGKIILTSEGTIKPGQSNIIVDLASLRSDSSRRDEYIQKRTLETSIYPTTELLINKISNLPWPLPNSGMHSFAIIGDMTIHGITHRITWDVTAEFDLNSISGQATTNFTFETFGMDIPRVFVVLSVTNNIRLEIDFKAKISR